MDLLATLARNAHDTMIGLELDQLAVDVCITKAPCGGELGGTQSRGSGQAGPQEIEHR